MTHHRPLQEYDVEELRKMAGMVELKEQEQLVIEGQIAVTDAVVETGSSKEPDLQ